MDEKKDHDPAPADDIVQVEKAVDGDQIEENPDLDRRLNRKFDLHILPWLFGIW